MNDLTIVLDWDNISDFVHAQRIEKIKKYYEIESFEVRASPSLNGYHIYITTYNVLPLHIKWRMRYELWDDREKLISDILEKKQDIRNVSFRCKFRGKHVFNEIKMFNYERINDTNEWQAINLKKECQKKVLLESLQ